ncbi:phospholipase D-like domain-containing protein [Streptomyces sp. 4N509B]|uniref:phospholipase D-like domain-containing protein n=1 Tax=Streptomyces sp. 4N509B TaxID=3457413 RepID=UPI003FD16E7A
MSGGSSRGVTGRRVPSVVALLCVVATLLAASLAAGPPAAGRGPAAQPGETSGKAPEAPGETAPTSGTSAAPAVVMNGPVFNDPAAGPGSGTPTAAQTAVFDQLVGLLDAVPAGERIHFAMFEFQAGPSGYPQRVLNSLVAAHDRGVGVRVILNTSAGNEPFHDALDAALGHDESARSWVVGCGSGRGCIARNYSHEKFALLSRVVLPGGVVHEDVVFQSSSNLNDWYVHNSYNDAYTFADPTSYAGYLTHFTDLQRGRTVPVDPDYWWTTPTGTTHRAHFYPRAQGTGDPIVNVLRGVGCTYQDEAGVTRQTAVRLVVSAFTQHRTAIAEELLRLRGENCRIEIVHAAGGIEPEPLAVLNRTASGGQRIQLTPCRYTVSEGHEVRPHAKVMLIDGHYDDDTVPRVYTGSANFTHLENSDDSQLRVMGRAVHDQYLAWFTALRAACGG